MELDRLTELRLCYEVRCNVRTLRKEAAHPGSVRGLVGDAIRRALAQHRMEQHQRALPNLGVSAHPEHLR